MQLCESCKRPLSTMKEWKRRKCNNCVEKEMDEGVKHDEGKLPLGLIPPEAQLAEAAILRHGATKYGKHNWRKGIAYSRVIDAALRHITAWIGGEDLDVESGLPHLAHARCCLGFLIAYEASGPRNDDRYRTMKHSRGAEDPGSVHDALRAEVKSMRTAIKAAAIEARREATAPKVAEEPKQYALPELPLDQCYLCFAKTTGKHPVSKLPMCQHCMDRFERANKQAADWEEQKIKLNKPTQLKCRSCGKVSPFGEGIIIDDDFKLCDDCVRPEHPCAGCGAATRRTFGVHGIPLCESCGDTKGEQAKDELYRKMRLWSVAQNEKAQANLEKSKQADNPEITRMTRTWHCEIEGGVTPLKLPLEYSAHQAAALAWGEYGEYTLHGEYGDGIVTVWADDQPRKKFYVTVREETRCYASEIEENAEPK